MSGYVDFLNFYNTFSVEDFIVVFLLYNFFKFLILTIFVELIWPTQFFNRRHSSGYSIIRFRTYTEVLLKLRNYSGYYYVFNIFFFNNKYIYRN